MAPKALKRKFLVHTSSSEMEDEEKEQNVTPHQMETESGAEDDLQVEQDNEEALWDFLYSVQALDPDSQIVTDEYDTYYKMFNPQFSLSDILKQCHEYIQEEHVEFERIISALELDVEGTLFVHLSCFGSKNSSSRKVFQRRLVLLPPNDCLLISNCPHHKGECRIIEKNTAFLLYLQTLTNTKEESFSLGRQPSPCNDVLEDVDETKEKTLALSFERVSYKSTTIAEVPVKEESLLNNDIPIPALPSFIIENKEYILLHDIQVIFNLREDYTLRVIAQALEDEKEWVLEDPVLGSLDCNFDPKNALELCFNEAKQYEKSLPTEEDFQDTQFSLNHHTQSLDELVNASEPEEPKDVLKESSIDIWTDNTMVSDENHQVN